MKTSWRRHIWIAVVAGTAISIMLFALNFAINPDHHPTLSNLVFTAQYPGWIACAFLLPGSFESTSNLTYIGIALPLNAASYASIVLAALRLLSRETRKQSRGGAN